MEFLYRFFSFDLAWLIGFIFEPSNLMWLFLFGAAAYYFYVNGTGKSLVWASVLVTFYLWTSLDFSKAVGWTIFDPYLLGLLTISGVVVLVFFANDPWGKNNLPLINTLRFLILLIIFNLFLM